MANVILLILCTMLFRFNGSPNITMKGVTCSLINILVLGYSTWKVVIKALNVGEFGKQRVCQ